MAVVFPDEAEIRQYQEWERASAREAKRTRYGDYAPAKLVFGIRRCDVPEQNGIVNCRALADGEVAVSVSPQADGADEEEILLGGALSEPAVSGVLEDVDGEKSVAEIIDNASGGVDPALALGLLDELTGRAILLPQTLDRLEGAVRYFEIVRIPVRSPYSISREYWENQKAIRQHLSGLAEALDSFPLFKAFLAQLHIIATLGVSRTNYYGGGGGIPTTPGGFRSVPVQTTVSEGMVDFIVGEIARAGFDYPVTRDKTLQATDGRTLAFSTRSARHHHHHYDGGADMDAKLEQLRACLVEVRDRSAAGDIWGAVGVLSDFHWLFSQLHPFANINNSIAMNLVNHCLATMNLGVMPHLFLDYCAHRTAQGFYRNIFYHYVGEFLAPGEPGTLEQRILRKSRDYYRRYLKIAA